MDQESGKIIFLLDALDECDNSAQRMLQTRLRDMNSGKKSIQALGVEQDFGKITINILH